MIKVKHFLEAVEPDDGQRIWVEPIGLTAELRGWCSVNEVMSHLGPPRHIWEWFIEHPDGYDYFRGCYHEWLNKGPYRETLVAIACAAMKKNITLLHQGDDAQHNTAMALYEFIAELEAYCPRDDDK